MARTDEDLLATVRALGEMLRDDATPPDLLRTRLIGFADDMLEAHGHPETCSATDTPGTRVPPDEPPR